MCGYNLCVGVSVMLFVDDSVLWVQVLAEVLVWVCIVVWV